MFKNVVNMIQFMILMRFIVKNELRFIEHILN